MVSDAGAGGVAGVRRVGGVDVSPHRRVDYGRGQDRTLRGKVPVECTIEDGPADGAVGRPDPRQTGTKSISSEWYGNNCERGTLSVHFPSRRQRSLDTRTVPPTGRIWPPSASPSWSLVSPRIASTPITATGPPRPRPGPRRRARRRHAGRAETRPPGQVRPGCTRHRRPASGTRRGPGPRPGALRPGRSHGKDVLQYPRRLRRVRSRSHKHATGECSISDLAELFSVSRPTVYRTLNRRLSS